jgi:hypothetical protein
MAHPDNKRTGRNYAGATAYESTPLQKKRRAARNKARRLLMRQGKVHKGDGKDVDHIKRSLGSILDSRAGNLRVRSIASNRARNSHKGK